MNSGEAIVAIAGMLTGVLTTGLITWGIVQAFRARAQARAMPAQLEDEVARLRDHVETLHQALVETQERLDFTERLLAQRPAPESLPRP